MKTTASLASRPPRHLCLRRQAVDWDSPVDGDGVFYKSRLEHV